MANSCVVKLSNTVVEKATVSSTDALKLLELVNSTIKEADLTMLMVSQSAPFMNGPPITLDASELTVTTADMEQLTEMEEIFLFSQNHSKAYFKALITPPEALIADPTWTPDSADSPTYGNQLSYNIGPVSYTLFEGFTDYSNVDGEDVLEARFKVTSMGSAETIRATAEWQDRTDPGWIAMSPAFIDVTDTSGEYSGSFIYDIGNCGEFDYRITLTDLDAPANTLVLSEENLTSFWCS